MARFVFLSVGLVRKDYSKNGIIEYLKEEVSKEEFSRLFVFASDSTKKNILGDFFSYLADSNIDYSVWDEEDNESIGYLVEIANRVGSIIPASEGFYMKVVFIEGFMVVKYVSSPLESEIEKFNDEN